MTSQRELPIIWDTEEFLNFKKLIADIKKRSARLAKHIQADIKGKIKLISKTPYIYEADSLKHNNDGTFRKFTSIHIRIVYKIDIDKIIILRVRHSASEPQNY